LERFLLVHSVRSQRERGTLSGEAKAQYEIKKLKGGDEKKVTRCPVLALAATGKGKKGNPSQ